MRLPIPYPASTLPPAESVRILKQQKEFLYFTQIEQYKTIAPGFTCVFFWPLPFVSGVAD